MEDDSAHRVFRTSRKWMWIESSVVAVLVGAVAYWIPHSDDAPFVLCLLAGILGFVACLGFYTWRYFKKAEGQIVVHQDWIGIDRGKRGRHRMFWRDVTEAQKGGYGGLSYTLKSKDDELLIRDDGIGVTDWDELGVLIYRHLEQVGVEIEGAVLVVDDEVEDDVDDPVALADYADDDEQKEVLLDLAVNEALQARDLETVARALDALDALRPENAAKYQLVRGYLSAVERGEVFDVAVDLLYLDEDNQLDYGAGFARVLARELELKEEYLLAAEVLDMSFEDEDKLRRINNLKRAGVEEHEAWDLVLVRMRNFCEEGLAERADDDRLKRALAAIEELEQESDDEE